MRSIHKVLVANRGEIACRVIAGARRLGLGTVAVYSEADRNARHVQEADQAVLIGPPSPAESYLDIERILAAAASSGADAVHPGYGFLAENADFAARCVQAGLNFIGPSSDSIGLMGNKRAAKLKMLEAGVPCVPGYEGGAQDDESLLEAAAEVGLPIMIKAAAGGGGRGMRLCEREQDLPGLIRSARSEAQSAFGSGELILERAVIGARHVEFQVFGDAQGQVVHLGERDCSIQRRHQKIVEESPSPAVSEDLRQAMGEAAVQAAAAIAYQGAGTVEFLLGADKQFYFLEMNTRLQVEHPVTEMVTGLDLVEWQFRIADGQPLPLSQPQIELAGHAIEVRICAEDARQSDMPQTGQVLGWREPRGGSLRLDHGVVEGGMVSPYYDSMLGKLIAHGPDREAARARLRWALDALCLHGVTSNVDFLKDILDEADFASGNFDTGYLPAHFPPESRAETAPTAAHWAVAAMVLHWDDSWRLCQEAGFSASMLNWRNSNATGSPIQLQWEDTEKTLRLSNRGRHCQVTVDEQTFAFEVGRCDGFEREFRLDGMDDSARYSRDGQALWVSYGGRSWAFADHTLQPPEAAVAGSDGRICAGSDGKVLAVHVTEGETVEAGQVVAVLEAMKMEFQLTTPVAGRVSAVVAGAGDQVANRQLIVELAVSD